MSQLTPTTPHARLAVLDVLRGLALCGVLIANAAHLFSGRLFAADDPLGGLDLVVDYIVAALVAGKAVALLTCLFGLGFAMQAARAAASGHDARALHLRRLAALVVIGLLHVALLWWGDVTWSYAVTGFALLLFTRCSDRCLGVTAILLIFVPHLLVAVPAVADAAATLMPGPADPAAFNDEFVATIRGDAYVPTITMHVRQAAYFVGRIAPWYFPWLLGHFLLGTLAARHALFADDGAAHLPSFRRALVPALVAGAVLTAGFLILHTDAVAARLPRPPVRLLATLVGELSVSALLIFYVSTIVLLLQRHTSRRLLMTFAPMGRMPLTMYLMQSLLCTFIYYGWGLGLSGRLGPAAVLAVSLLLCTFQLALAAVWLRRFRYGPMEWLWRTLAYGRT